MTHLLLYASFDTPRLHYTAALLGQLMGISQVSCTTDWEYWQNANDCARLNYSDRATPHLPRLLPHELLTRQDIVSIPLTFRCFKGLPAAFWMPVLSKDQVYPFDLLALLFYLASRYEEYLPYEADAWGRFPATSSIAHQAGFLQRPLLQEWALDFAQCLCTYYPDLKLEPHTYQYTPTYDIDHAFAFHAKPLWRQAGAFARNVLHRDTHALKQHWTTFRSPQQDPYRVYDYLDGLAQAHQLSPIYFWLLGDYGPHDKNLPHTTPALQKLIREQAQQYRLGIHPSFASNETIQQLTQEYHRLTTIVQHPIHRSRQHYLRLHLPTTYRRLIQLGITDDYTLGYARVLGFRASLALPYYWYDLEQETTTNLCLHPFTIMDVTLNTYLGLSPEAALEATHPIVEHCRKVGGHLITIWHNSSLCEAWQWVGWRRMYEGLLKQATDGMD